MARKRHKYYSSSNERRQLWLNNICWPSWKMCSSGVAPCLNDSTYTLSAAHQHWVIASIDWDADPNFLSCHLYSYFEFYMRPFGTFRYFQRPVVSKIAEGFLANVNPGMSLHVLHWRDPYDLPFWNQNSSYLMLSNPFCYFYL